MAGYWPSSFFACLWTEKKRTRPISSHLDWTNLVNKGFIVWLLVKFCLRDTAGSPERARWLHLASSGSQSQRAIWFILPAHRALTERSPSREQGWPTGESARLPPMWPGFDSRTRRHMWAEFVGSLLCSERFFSGNSGFPLSSKTNI